MLLDVAEPATTDQPAAWLRQGITTFAESVCSILPPGFDRYARLFHPARRDPDGELVRWSDIALANGREPHRQMQWPGITGSKSFWQGATQPGLWDEPPLAGSLPTDLASALLETLSRHTSTPDRCWFAVWEGFGGLSAEMRQVQAFELPHRRYHLLGGAIAAILETAEAPPWEQSANIWWPQDQAWCVATEIDFSTTYLAVSESCLSKLQKTSDIEVMEADPTDGITWASDTINPSDEQ